MTFIETKDKNEILVANIVERMKWSDSEQLAAYTLRRSVTLVLSLSLLTGFAVQSLLTWLPCREGSHCVIIASGWLKPNFKKANKRQQHYSKYLLVNELFTRKIETIFINSSIYWLPLIMFFPLAKAYNISLAGATIERCISMAASGLILRQLLF